MEKAEKICKIRVWLQGGSYEYFLVEEGHLYLNVHNDTIRFTDVNGKEYTIVNASVIVEHNYELKENNKDD